MGNGLTKAALLDFGIQWGLFLIAAFLKTEKFYDLAGSGTCLLTVLLTLIWGGVYHKRQIVHTAMVGTWALRLGSYLAMRISRYGKDRRFDGIRDSPGKFFIYWTLQGVWVYATMLPTIITNLETRDSAIGPRDWIGWTLWVFGFILEATADYQKSAFRKLADNKNRFIKSGVWSWSRHPNYFGEMVMWCGLYLSATKVFRGWQHHLAIISPIFVIFLLTKVSGIPLLEKRGLRKWGEDASYQDYIRHVHVLVPVPPICQSWNKKTTKQ